VVSKNLQAGAAAVAGHRPLGFKSWEVCTVPAGSVNREMSFWAISRLKSGGDRRIVLASVCRACSCAFRTHRRQDLSPPCPCGEQESFREHAVGWSATREVAWTV